MPSLPPRFWQALLSVHLPASRTALLLEEVRSSSYDPVASLLGSKHLSEKEKELVRRADSSALDRALAAGVTVLENPTYTEGIDPALFPAALFCWGHDEVLSGPRLAVVGTRKCTTYGQAAAQKFAEHLSLAGVCILSGGAMGIDTAAHRGALDGSGRTAAVMPAGLDAAIKGTNKALCDQIRAKGCLLSQFGFGVNADNKTPLFRNEVVAALADAVLVVEAPHASGSLHTANHALEQGKPVFVCPGPITNPSFNGSHELIRAGATLVYHPDQILRDMDWEGSLIRPEGAHSELRTSILSELSAGPLTTDALAARLDLDPLDLGEELSDMEMERLIMRHGAGYSVV